MVLGISEGALEMKLESGMFEPGKPIKGKIVIHSNKKIRARQLRVNFYGLLKPSPQSGELVRVFEVESVICGEAIYTDDMTFGFELTPPVEINAAKPNKILGLFSPAKAVSETRPRFWVLQATLDIPMATDLNKQIELIIRPE
ncbi:MAG: hypothetical protein WCT52_02820 [Candidatus Micrarchaeia archaeon]